MSVITILAGTSTIAAVPALLAIGRSWASNVRGHTSEFALIPAWPVIAAPILLMVPALGLALRVQDTVGYWFGGVSTGAIAGLGVVSAARALAKFRAIETPGASLIAAIGFLPVAAWLLGLSVIGVRDHAVPAAFGALSAMVVTLGSLGGSAVILDDRGTCRWFVAVLMVVSVAWLGFLAFELLAA